MRKPRLLLKCAMVIAALVAMSTARAATITWTDGAGDDLWSSPLNWTGGELPPGNSIIFTNTGASSVEGVVTSIVDDAFAIGSLTFNNSSSGYQYLGFLTGSSASLSGSLVVSSGGRATFGGLGGLVQTGSLSISDGRLNVNDGLLLEVTGSTIIGMNGGSGALSLASGGGLHMGKETGHVSLTVGRTDWGYPWRSSYGTFIVDSSTNPDVSLYLSSVSIGVTGGGDMSATGRVDLSKFTGPLVIDNLLIGQGPGSEGHFTFGNPTLSHLAIPSVDIGSGDLTVNSGASLDVTGSLRIGHNYGTGALKLNPGAGLHVGSASQHIGMTVGHAEWGAANANTYGSFAPDSALNPDVSLYLSTLTVGQTAANGQSATGRVDLSKFTGPLVIDNLLIGQGPGSEGHFTFGNPTLSHLAIPSVDIGSGDLTVNCDTTLEITGGLYAGPSGTVNLNIGGVSAGLLVENASPSALSLGSGTGRIKLTFEAPDVSCDYYWGLCWKGDHVSQLSSWLSGGDYLGDGRILAFVSDGVDPSDLDVGLMLRDGIQYTYIGFKDIILDAPIPAPGALVLVCLGAGLVKLAKRRRVL